MQTGDDRHLSRYTYDPTCRRCRELREADDVNNPHDAAERDFVEFLRRHRDVVRHAHLDVGGHHNIDRCLSYGSHLFSGTPRDARSLSLDG